MRISTKWTIGIVAVIVAALVWTLAAISTPTGPSPNPPGGLATRTPQVSNATATPRATPCAVSICTTPTPQRTPCVTSACATATATPTRLPVSKPTPTPTRKPAPISTIPVPVPSAASTRVPVPIVTAVVTRIPPIPTVPVPVGTKGVGERALVEMAGIVGPMATPTLMPVLLCAERVQAGDKHLAVDWYDINASPTYTYARDPINIEVQLVTVIKCGVVGERYVNVDWEVGSSAPAVTWAP